MKSKQIAIVFYARSYPRQDWEYNLDMEAMGRIIGELATELEPLGVVLNHWQEDGVCIDIRGYGDLLNAVRIRSPKDSLPNVCLGHVIGQSPNADLAEDIRRAVNRVAFAPETIEPEGSDKIVCHNCGCGC